MTTGAGSEAWSKMPLVEEQGDLRPKNQITVPKAIAKVLGLRPGDRLMFEVREGEPDEIHVRRLRDDYAGSLAGMYGDPDEVTSYLEEEHEAWRS